MKRPHAAAFTLIELLVVVAIIAILAGLLFAMSPGIMKRGRQVQTLNNLRQIATGFTLYAADNDGRLPSRPSDSAGGEQKWPFLIHSYLKEKKVFAAPDDPSNYLRSKEDPLSNDANNTSYIMNGGWDPGPEPTRALVLPAISQPSKTIMLGVIFDDVNFFLDVNNGDEDLVKPDLFGTSNDYVFMDGSARALEEKEYRKMEDDGGKKGYLWLINKNPVP